MSRFHELAKQEGKNVYSDYITKTYELETDIIKYLLFPLGGSQVLHPLLLFKYNDNDRAFLAEGLFEFKSPFEMR